jgi:hypothetical protein
VEEKKSSLESDSQLSRQNLPAKIRRGAFPPKIFRRAKLEFLARLVLVRRHQELLPRRTSQ